MIDPKVAAAADALMETVEVAERTHQLNRLLPDLVPLFATALMFAQRELAIYLAEAMD